jgi:protein arginine N-methyltransferase 1
MRFMRFILQRLKGVLKSSQYVQNLLYDAENKEEFSDLYEHEKMLADSVRVNSYYEAIRRYVKPGDVVVDLGTGSGILALMAAQQKPKKIYAIDHSDFIRVAEKIADHNHIEGIVFERVNSREFRPTEKADVMLHEQIGDLLLEENMVENLLDLKKRVLKETGKILPGKFELFLEPVCLKDNRRIPFLWENSFYGIEYAFLRNDDDLDRYKSRRYDRRFIPNGSVDYFLCEPAAILSFDLNHLTDSNDIPSTIGTSKKTIRPGMMDGLCLFFRVIFDDEISFDTSPLHDAMHWGVMLFRTERRTYDRGDEVSYRLTMDDVTESKTWSVSVRD